VIHGDVGAVLMVLVLVFDSLDALGVDKSALADVILSAAKKMPEVEDESPDSARNPLLKFHRLMTGSQSMDTLFH